MSLKFNFFPALRAKMGDWDYYITRMRMSDVIREVQFASEFGAQEDQVDLLSQARQRALSKNRVAGEIMKFLTQDSRFFSSLVVATIKGGPKFFPVKVSDDSAINVFEDSDEEETFGFLRLDQGRQMYALDGQHRLSAIKCMLDASYRKKMGIKDDEGKIKIPAGFADEQISVILVVRGKDETSKGFHVKYRRLFSSLNRYAKKTDDVTNIIMDEDDAYAILTRRLISEHWFFKDAENKKEAESTKVKMKAGENLTRRDPQFIPLKVLYQVNENLLKTKERMEKAKLEKAKDPWDKQVRPEDQELEDLYKELSNYWDAIFGALPDLRKMPLDMRPNSGDGHLFFRPIGQKCLASLVRNILDGKPALNGGAKVPDMQKRLSVLATINWDVQSTLWDGLVVIWDENGAKMRNQDRDKVMKLVEDMVLCMMGDENMLRGVDNLRLRWEGLVILSSDKINKKQKWENEVLPLLTKKNK